jgi:hypothetical protein
LCIASAHRWEPERPVVIFTAYFDESNASVAKPNLILAAFLGTARQWELFERRIKRMQREYDFKVFHATDFRARQGEFKGWSDSKAEQFITELAELIHTGLAEGLVVTLPYELFEVEYLKTPFPKGMRKDSQYGFAFRFCLHQLIKLISADKKRHKLRVVVEEGQPQDIFTIFDELKKEYAELGYDVLGMISIGSKQNTPPLMIADFQAHLGFLSERLARDGLPAYTERTDRQPQKGRAGLTFMQFTPEVLRGVKEVWQNEKEQRAAQWRARRDAKRASASSPEASAKTTVEPDKPSS